MSVPLKDVFASEDREGGSMSQPNSATPRIAFSLKHGVVEALQWTGVNLSNISSFCPIHASLGLEVTDWIIKYWTGEFRAVTATYFDANFSNQTPEHIVFPISQRQPPVEMTPIEQKSFYMVWCRNGRAPTKTHDSHRDAMSEATRICAKEQKEVFVLQAISLVEPTVTVKQKNLIGT